MSYRSPARIVALVFSLTSSLISFSAFAAATTGVLTVSASVAPNCTLSTTPVAFGAYDPLGSGNSDATGAVSIACVKGTAPSSVDLNLGANASGSIRRMHGAVATTEYISYELYKPASVTPGAGCAYSAVWGVGATNGLVPTAATNKNARSYNVCGRTALGQDVGADSYSDSVTATVNF